MKQLKFRVWNPEIKQMLGENQGQIVIKLNGKLRDSHTGHGTFTEDERNPDWPVMQFTGLKDKNGVEIYEGDIVEYSLDGNDFKDEVIWENFGWVLRDFQIKSSFPLTAGPEYTVVGNIFDLDKS